MYTGPHLIKDNLVFGYDTGYGIANNNTDTRFYPGRPTTNILSNTVDFNNWTSARNSGSYPTVTANTSANPLGKSYGGMADKVYIPEDGTYPRIQQYFTPSSTNTHTFSVWIRSLSGDCDCFLGAFRNSPWSLPGHSVKNITSEWQRFTFSWTPPDTTTHVIYMGSHDTAAQKGNTLEFWGAQMENNSNSTPYTPGSRSSTQSLIDLKKTTNIDVSNVSFDSTGQPEFDGSSDYVDLGADLEVSPINQGWTAEYVFNSDTAEVLQHFNGCEEDTHNAGWIALYQGKLQVWNRSPGVWKKGSTTFASNTWYHVAFVQESGTSMQFYVNGVAEGGDHVSYSWNASKSAFFARYIGRYEYNGGYSRYWNGHMPVTRLYNKPLTASEIKQNFNVYRNRFGI